MTDNQPTVQQIYAQIKGNPSAYAELMSSPDHDALAEKLVQICRDAGLKDMTAAKMTRFLDRDLGDMLHELDGEDQSIDEGLELVAAGGGTQNNVGKR